MRLALLLLLAGCPAADTDPDTEPVGTEVDPDTGPGTDVDTDSADTDTEADTEPDTAECPPPGEIPVPEVLADLVPLPLVNVHVDERLVTEADCAWAESCVGGLGHRRLLRFGMKAANLGEADLFIGRPADQGGLFEHSLCHGHDHFLDFAHYDLLDAEGDVVREGHKQAFCLTDTARVDPEDPDTPPTRTYSCVFQGITRGWYDLYGASLDCQWVDVTGLPAGEYVLRVQLNPSGVLPEASLDNNVIEQAVTIPPPDLGRACGAGDPRGSERDCGWTLGAQTTCTPGTRVAVGCGAPDACPGTCEGDPMLRVCEGLGKACGAAADLASRDDACGSDCPHVEVLCPASGEITAWTGGDGVCGVAFGRGQPVDPTASCEGAAAGGSRECGWAVSGGAVCTPGEWLWVGCEAGGCGLSTCPAPADLLAAATCDGDPVLRVCPGDAPCVEPLALGFGDDACGGQCPAASVRCPAGGRITVLTAPAVSGRQATCAPVVIPDAH